MVSANVGSLTIEAARGDLTEFEADAIVNAANNALWMGGGVAGAIKRKGGAEIEREAVAKGPIEIGAAVHTSAGSLPARYVIHGAVMGTDLVTDAEKIRAATWSCLQVADELGLRSIAFPAFGTGVGGFPPEQAAEAMVEAVVRFAGQPSSLRRVSFVLFSEDVEQPFARRLQVLSAEQP
ncbi:MAG: macro domain-containing protein [Armatimonadota bacterium]